MEIFKLFGSILIDSSDAEKSISKTGQEAEGLGSKLSSGIKTAAKWAAGIAASATAVGTAMVAAAKKSADALGDIDDAAQRVGVDAETMQELEYVAKQSGLAMTDLEKAAKKLEGTDLNLDQAINQILALEDAEAQTQMAIELFGESVAYNLQPLLNHGAEGVEEFKNQARDLGIIMSNEAVESGAQFGDMFEAVQSSLNSLKTGLMAEFMPYALEILQWLIDNIPKIKETIQTVVDFVMPVVTPVLRLLMDVLESTMDLLNGDFEGFIDKVKEAFTKFGKDMFEIGKNIITALWDGCKEVWNKVAEWFSEKIQWVKDTISGWFEKGSENAANAVQLSTSGSHASGLNYVPYDGYIAELHRGESVNTAGQTQALIEAINSLKGSHGNNGPIELNISLDSNQIAHAIYNPLQNEGRRRGVSLVNG